jgi:carbonic anhydrase/acetyltransferase-like protein (isoleucine patch superfamily)
VIAPDRWQVAVDPTAWVAPAATVVGSVTIGKRASVWYGAVLRGDGEPIAVGEESNLQDGCVLHTDPDFPVRVGRGVSIGHRAVLHGCTVGDDVLVGMGSIIMNGASIGAGSIVGAGALVPEGMDVPPRSLVLGMPGKVRRPTTDEELAHIVTNAAAYVASARIHRAHRAG